MEHILDSFTAEYDATIETIHKEKILVLWS